MNDIKHARASDARRHGLACLCEGTLPSSQPHHVITDADLDAFLRVIRED